MCIVEAQVMRASEDDEPVVVEVRGFGWHLLRVLWHEVKSESQSARKGIPGYSGAEKP